MGAIGSGRHRPISHTIIGLAIFAIGMCLSHSVYSQERPTDATPVEDAVVYARVERRDFRLEEGEQPFTYVTFQRLRVIRGNDVDETLTLRFPGGPLRDFAERSLVAFVEHVPLFDEGEAFILFLESDATAECPLVGCDQDLLRVIDDVVYTYEGDRLWRDKYGDIVTRYEETLSEDAATHTILGETLYRWHGGTPPSRTTPEDEGLEQLSLDAFITIIASSAEGSF